VNIKIIHFNMRLKKFNELNEADQPIKHKDVQEQIDEILDNLSKKKKLSKSEKKFMKEASNGTIGGLTVPNPTGNFWADMGNPHNMGTMWVGKEGIWDRLKTVEEEDDEELESTETSDQTWERKKKRKILKHKEELLGLTETINEWAVIVKDFNKQQTIYYNRLMDLAKDKDFDYKYQYEQKVEYATNGKMESLFNQFGPLITSVKEDDDEDDDE
jgi:hypothetical protein